jgi:hypothetical protein
VIVCTLPPGVSRWLRADLVSRVERASDLPVSHVFAPSGWPERIPYRAQRLAFLPELDDLLTEGLVVRESVDVVKYAGRHEPRGDR